MPSCRRRSRAGCARQATKAEHVEDVGLSEANVRVIDLPVELDERIGKERRFKVDMIPPKLVKLEIVRSKYRHWLDRTWPPFPAPARRA